MAGVKVRTGESVASALRRFKKVVDEEGILKTVRDRQFYEKPSRKRYLQRKKAKFDQRVRSKYDY